MCSLCRLPVAKYHNFGQSLTFGGLFYRPFLGIDEGQIWCAIAAPWYMFSCQNSYRSVYSVALWRRKTPILPFFGLRHLVASTVGSNLRKLHNHKPSPTEWHHNRFCTPTLFMAKSGAQSLTSKSMTDRQTDRQTKNVTFWGRRRVKSKPHETWQDDRGLRAHSCTSKTFGV